MAERARTSSKTTARKGARGGGSPGPRRASSEHPLLRLQRTAGNVAIARHVQREDLHGNPAELTDSTGAATTQTGTVGLADASNAPQMAAPGLDNGARHVRVVASETAPLNASPDTCPDPRLVYAEEQTPTPGHTPVAGLTGTIDRPLLTQEADNSLYVDGRPRPQDVEQYGIGDCYGLATIISIAARDPGKIQSMMTPDGSGGAAVTFYKRVARPADPATGTPAGPATGPLASNQVTYEAVTVHADGRLAFELDASGGVRANAHGGGQINGAQLRAGERPKKTEYWGTVAGDRLELYRREVYSMGRWAPVLEKAWARFAEVHGQYGQEQRGPEGTGEATGGSGYAAIDGGWSHRVMTAFYGEAAEPGGSGGVQQVATNFTAGSNLVTQNAPVVDQLLLLHGLGESGNGGGTTSPIITATAMDDPLIDRLGLQIAQARSDADWRNIRPPTRRKIEAVAAAVTAHQAAVAATYPTQAAATAATTATKNAVAAACVAAVKPDRTWSVLRRPGRSAATLAMVELMLDLRNAGTDNSTGQRNIYGNHVYSVRGFTLALNDGAPVPTPLPSGPERAALYAQIDPAASRVRLQNPHHGNEPDELGTGQGTNPSDGPAAGADSDGVFTMTLDQFLRNFTSVESGVFTTS